MKSLIFGYGITGRSFARYLRKKGIDFDIYDEKVKGPVRFLDDRSPPEVNIFWQLFWLCFLFVHLSLLAAAFTLNNAQ